jgi:NADPH2:quinone reductase
MHDDEALVRSFGADVVVSRGEGFITDVRNAAPDGADGLYDTALLHETAFGAIRDSGSMIVVRGWQPQETERGIQVKPVMVSTALERTDWLEELRRLASDRRLQLRVAGEYPPEQAAEAEHITDAGGLRGRIVIVF